MAASLAPRICARDAAARQEALHMASRGPRTSAVELTPNVLWVCLTHAMTTEKQEVMSLLLGDWVDQVRRAAAAKARVVEVPRAAACRGGCAAAPPPPAGSRGAASTL